MSNSYATRLVVVSNRLPISLAKREGEWTLTPGAGGLVTALAPVLMNRGGLWIGWPGAAADDDLAPLLSNFSKDAGYSLHPVFLDAEEVENYYQGFSNEIIWPLFHDLPSRCNFQPGYWRSYLNVNLRFAEVTARHSRASDYVWVHDYHLMHLAFLLRNMGVERQCGFFLHIPFPPPDIFLKLPWRAKVIRALLEYDLVGFQTLRDRRNFVACMEALVPGVRVGGRGNIVTISWKNRQIRAGSFPISIDFNSFADLASDREVAKRAEEIREALRNRKIILGVDRLDYTKGIPERLRAIRQLFISHPELQEEVTFVQIAVPSREDIPEYFALKNEIEQLVGEINGQFTRPGWIPIHYQYRNLPRRELTAYYRAADMALVTPLRDGMNLVAKEYCAANTTEEGVLFLSEFAGAAAQLQKLGAILVNPYDVEGTALAIQRASVMNGRERRARMGKLRDSVRRNNIYWWVDSFLQAAFAKHLDDFPQETVDFRTIAYE